MGFVRTALLAGAAAVWASGASSAVLSFATDGRQVNYSVVDANPAVSGDQGVSGSALAGSFTATQTSPGTTGYLGNGIAMTGIATFCLDLAGGLAGGEFEVNNINPYQPGRILTTTQIANVKTLYNASYGLVDNNNRNQSAAFQLALWEVAYEATSAPFSLTGGNFRSTISTTTDGSIGSLALTYLSRMTTNTNAFAYNVHFLDAVTETAQDLVTATPVPLPAAGFLLIGGLGALAMVRRRREAASA